MAVLGHPETGNPKSMTQLNATHPLKPSHIGICKDMMSSMDPMRALGLQDEVAGTSIITRKFFSSIFCWKGLHKLQEGESKNTKDKLWQNHLNYPGSSAQAITIKATPAQTHFKRNNSWSVG